MQKLLLVSCSLIALLAAARARGAELTPELMVLTNSILITPALINQLADEARTNNPALRAADARVVASEANAAGVRTWENPELIGGGVVGDREMRQEDGDIIYGLEQKLPLFGKPRAEREVARAQSKGFQARAEYQFQMLRLEIARQILRTALADRVVAISAEDLTWLNTLLRSAEDRYRVGQGSQVEVARIHHDRQTRADQLITDQKTAVQERIVLNRLLNRPFETAWPRLDLPEIGPAIAYTEKLNRMVLLYEARLKVMRQEVTENEAMVAATRRSRLPDISVGLEGRNYSGNGEFREGVFLLRFSLPWANREKYRRDLERDQAKLQAAQLDIADYELFVPTEARRLVLQIDSARRRAVLYRDDVIPRSELALNSAQAAWLGNRGTFLELMDLRRLLLQDRLMYARAITEQYQLLSELSLCCGVADLEALEIIATPEEPKP